MTPNQENPPLVRVPSSGLLDPATALEVYDSKMNRSIKVEIVEPVTITTRESVFFSKSTSFTSYLILIETDHWAFSLPLSDVRRRYSEFSWLRSKLQAHHPNKTLPPLPPKRYLHMTKFDPKVIEERRFGLGKFIQRLLRSSELLSDAALHLFLQSQMSVEEIDEKLGETIKPGLRKSRLTPYLLRSLSTGSTGSASGSESDYPVGDRVNELDLIENEACETDLREMNKLGRKGSFNANGQLILQDMISLTITHEDTNEVVQVANSPLEPPMLCSLVFNSATESGRTQPLSVK